MADYRMFDEDFDDDDDLPEEDPYWALIHNLRHALDGAADYLTKERIGRVRTDLAEGLELWGEFIQNDELWIVTLMQRGMPVGRWELSMPNFWDVRPVVRIARYRALEYGLVLFLESDPAKLHRRLGEISPSLSAPVAHLRLAQMLVDQVEGWMSMATGVESYEFDPVNDTEVGLIDLEDEDEDENGDGPLRTDALTLTELASLALYFECAPTHRRRQQFESLLSYVLDNNPRQSVWDDAFREMVRVGTILNVTPPSIPYWR